MKQWLIVIGFFAVVTAGVLADQIQRGDPRLVEAKCYYASTLIDKRSFRCPANKTSYGYPFKATDVYEFQKEDDQGKLTFVDRDYTEYHGLHTGPNVHKTGDVDQAVSFNVITFLGLYSFTLILLRIIRNRNARKIT